jgi:hypothetical protein
MSQEHQMVLALLGLGAAAAALFIGDLLYRGDGDDTPVQRLIWNKAGYLAVACWITIVVSMGCLIWVYPEWSTSGLKSDASLVDKQLFQSQNQYSKDRFDAELAAAKAESDARSSVIQAFGGIVLLGGLYFTFRTLTSTAKTSLLQCFGEAVNLFAAEDSPVKRAAGESMIRAINKEPEGRDLGILPQGHVPVGENGQSAQPSDCRGGKTEVG